MKVAICEDENTYAQSMADMFTDIGKKNGIKYDIRMFESGEELVEEYRQGRMVYDIVLMDIEMKELSGLEAAEEIHNLDKNVEIIFITNYEHYVFECFKSRPYDFFVKPVDEERFFRVIKALTEKICRERNTFTIKKGKSYVRMEFRSVDYFESAGHKIMIRMASGRAHEFYGSAKSVAELLEGKDFVRCHKSFFVNLNSIRELHPDEAVLESGACVPISRSCCENVRNAYFKYLSREMIM